MVEESGGERGGLRGFPKLVRLACRHLGRARKKYLLVGPPVYTIIAGAATATVT